MCASHGSLARSLIFSGNPVALEGPWRTNPARRPMVPSPVSRSSSPPPVHPADGIETPGGDRPGPSRHMQRVSHTACGRARPRTEAAQASSSVSINRPEPVYRGAAALRRRAVVEPATPRRAFLNAATAAGRSTSRETAPARRSTTARTLTRLLLETRSTVTPTVPSANPSRRTAIRIRDRVGPECST